MFLFLSDWAMLLIKELFMLFSDHVVFWLLGNVVQGLAFVIYIAVVMTCKQ